MKTWEAIKQLSENNEIVFKAKSDKQDRVFYLTTFYWVGVPFVRLFEIYNNEFNFQRVITLSDDVNWEITNEIDGFLNKSK
jgi:hypothetical protein